MDETETGEEAHVDSDGTDHEYTQQDDPTDEDEGDNGLDASAHKPQANTGKVPKRNRSDTMYLAGIRGLEKKKSKQDLHGSQQRSERVRIDLTGSRMSKKRQIPWTPHPPVSKPPMTMKAMETQILSTDSAVFSLAKPILASVLYSIDPWPSCSQTENALCNSAWSQAPDT